MTARSTERGNVAPLATGVRHLVRIAGAVAGADEATVRSVMNEALNEVDPRAVDEIILQSYLFAGFPRTLNAARTWRTVSGTYAPEPEQEFAADDVASWRERGLRTCKVVYGDSYEGLRRNIKQLHPTLDEWMIVDGYGKVLSRPSVDLRTRELCVVAACAVAGQQRQLHSHLHGALNAGATLEEVEAVLDSLADLVSRENLATYRQLLRKVANQ